MTSCGGPVMTRKNVIVVLLKDSQQAHELAAALAPARVIVTRSADDFRRALAEECVNVAVVEHKLDGETTGLAMLQGVYTDLFRPRALLVGEPAPLERDAATRLGIDVVRSAPPAELAKVVNVRCAAEVAARPSLPFEVRKFVANADFIGPNPQLLIKLVNYLDVESASIKELARDVSVDPRTTAELLKLTNSAACGLRRKATTVNEAVNLLGIRRTVSLILSAGVVSTQRGLMQGVPEKTAQWFQRRSVQIASVAATFAGEMEKVTADTAHVLGLLQDLGILILYKTFPSRYATLLERVNSIGHLQLAAGEQQAFGFTHAAVTAALLEKWELPDSFVQLALAHHDAEDADDLPEIERRFRRSMQIGEAVADCVDSPTVHRQHMLQRRLSHYGAESAERVKACVEKATAKASELCTLFSMPAPDPLEISLLIPELQGLVGDFAEPAEAATVCA